MANLSSSKYPTFMPLFECCLREPRYARECYHYYEEVDMGAHIPYCGSLKINCFEPPNCNKKCPYYITKSEVYKMVEENQKYLIEKETERDA